MNDVHNESFVLSNKANDEEERSRQKSRKEIFEKIISFEANSKKQRKAFKGLDENKQFKIKHRFAVSIICSTTQNKTK